MKRSNLKLGAVLVASMLVSAPVMSYDQAAAESFAKMFSSVQGPKAGRYLHTVKPDEFVEGVREGKPYVTLDIRTPNETMFYTASLPGHLVIPMNELFKPEQLAKLPKDRPIIVFCKSGTRATAAMTGLRYVGYDNTWVLKGGLMALSKYLGPKEANQPLKQVEPTKAPAR